MKEIIERVTIVEVKVDVIEKQLDTIANNHLHHIQQDITKIKVWQAYYAGGTAVFIAILEFIIKFLFK